MQPVATGILVDAENLLRQVRNCTLCAAHLPMGVRPVLQVHPDARVLIVSQAPGLKVHRSGLPFDDASGDRLRAWMGIDRSVFYDSSRVAIVPMGFCYPGTDKSGDMPPRPECAPRWRQQVLAHMPGIALTLVIGQYAQAWHFPKSNSHGVTSLVQRWAEFAPCAIPLPHPSPRNNIWLKRNPWFATDVVPELQVLVLRALA
jgi:uracil-DNA glycosylase